MCVCGCVEGRAHVSLPVRVYTYMVFGSECACAVGIQLWCVCVCAGTLMRATLCLLVSLWPLLFLTVGAGFGRRGRERTDLEVSEGFRLLEASSPNPSASLLPAARPCNVSLPVRVKDPTVACSHTRTQATLVCVCVCVCVWLGVAF